VTIEIPRRSDNLGGQAMSGIRITGGCQCGAVRYALHEEPTGAHICHCRMCQKLSIFKSSDPTERGFCNRCGTPLTIHDTHSSRIAVSIGSLDEPEKFEPQKQYGIESRMSWFGKLPTLTGDKTTEEDNPDLAQRIAASSHQHPDHDTSEWPAREAQR
jgi:hypothetical protein